MVHRWVSHTIYSHVASLWSPHYINITELVLVVNVYIEICCVCCNIWLHCYSTNGVLKTTQSPPMIQSGACDPLCISWLKHTGVFCLCFSLMLWHLGAHTLSANTFYLEWPESQRYFIVCIICYYTSMTMNQLQSINSSYGLESVSIEILWIKRKF